MLVGLTPSMLSKKAAAKNAVTAAVGLAAALVGVAAEPMAVQAIAVVVVAGVGAS